MSLLAGSVSNVPPPTTSPRPVAAVPLLESRKRCHTDRPLDQVARQLDFEMVIEEGPLLHEGTVGGEDQAPDEGMVSGEDQGPDEGKVRGEDQGPDEVTVRGEDQGPDEGTVRGEDQGPDEGTVRGEDQGPDEGTVRGEDQGPDPETVNEDGPEDDEHAVGEEGEHHAPVEEEYGNPEKSALVPLLQLIVQVISVAGAHESANVVAEVFPNTIFKLRKWFGMDDASNFQKMVCCNKCYRIYPDDASMRYRSKDRHRKLLTRPCYGAVVEKGRDFAMRYFSIVRRRKKGSWSTLQSIYIATNHCLKAWIIFYPG